MDSLALLLITYGIRRGFGHLARELETNPAALAHGGLEHFRAFLSGFVTSFPFNAFCIVAFLINMSC